MKVATLLDGLTGQLTATVGVVEQEPLSVAVDALAQRGSHADIEAAIAADPRWWRVGAISGQEVYRDPWFVHPSEEPTLLAEARPRRRSASRRWDPQSP